MIACSRDVFPCDIAPCSRGQEPPHAITEEGAEGQVAAAFGAGGVAMVTSSNADCRATRAGDRALRGYVR
eukprot:scaffold2009_cov370-Prasinococcus_capsulatus_cf.AAC.5